MRNSFKIKVEDFYKTKTEKNVASLVKRSLENLHVLFDCVEKFSNSW